MVMDRGDADSGSVFTTTVTNTATEIRRLAALRYAEEAYDEARVESGAPNMPAPQEGSGIWQRYYDSLSWIEDLFEPWSTLADPNDSVPIVEALSDLSGDKALPKGDSSVLAELGGTDAEGVPGAGILGNESMDRISTIEANVAAEWTGRAANAFYKLIANFDPALRNQIILGRILRELAIANHDLLTALREDVRAIQADTITALEALEDSSDGTSVATVLTVAACVGTMVVGGTTLAPVAAMAAAALAPGDVKDEKPSKGKARLANAQGALVAFGGANALKSFLAGGDSDKKEPESPLGADTVDGVMENLAAAVKDLTELMMGREDDIILICEKNIEFIHENSGNHLAEYGDLTKPMIISPRPKQLVDVPPSETNENFRDVIAT